MYPSEQDRPIILSETRWKGEPDLETTAHYPYWLGYTLQVGERFRLLPIGSEAEIDKLMEEYNRTGYMTLPSLRIGPHQHRHEYIKVRFAVKLHASEAVRSVPYVHQTIDNETGIYPPKAER